MKMFSMFLTALMGIGLVQAMLLVCTLPTRPTIIDINWSLQVNNTDTPWNLTVTGTIQDLFSNYSKVDPKGAAALNKSMHGDLQGRDVSSNPTTTLCNFLGDSASASRIAQGVSYLREVPGKPSNGPGPGECGRVSCSYNSAIWWCNDNLVTKVLDSFGNIADGAQQILTLCDPNYHHASVNGQQFYNDDWNVIVRGASC
ncbi:hypothetical protein VP1G_06578 [Cytospora mali]|uniref:Uncharacterized protein n=1 Tax=Cytospora mali TaxID=578113 RepID=A0A194V5V2_CYTMA|nr:hypothetical protein VP1G_06578 [Valsa mali var. pyri (nom. inval.)]